MAKNKPKINKLILIIVLIAAISIASFALYNCYFEKKIYPLKYQDIIALECEKYDIDPYLVYALIKVESGYDSNAISGAGAQGLMQIMPETAEWIARKLNLDEYNIFDAKTNIEMGCWYINFLQERFEDKDTLLAAYNAGHNKVESWLKEGYSKDGIHLEKIPYKETEKYVDKVNFAYEKYKKIYKDS